MSLRRELARKLLHVSTAVFPVAYAAGLETRIVVGVLAALLVVALVVETVRRRSPAGAAVFTRTTGVLLREHEHAGAWAGATWLLAAFLLAVVAFPRAVAVAAMLGVSLGDAAAAVIGRWWGSRRARRVGAGAPPGHQPAAPTPDVHHPPSASVSPAPPAPSLGIAVAPKTWVGTFACAAATALGALLVARLSVGESLLAGALAAVAERPRIALDDNLRITVAVGAGILLCRLAFS